METKQASSPIIASAGMTSSVMGIKASGLDQAAYFLRDRIYTDKIGAVVRETFSNATDEHVKHKINKAVEVGLRSTEDGTEFFCRDFAKGLSEHDIRNVFGMYFSSTKSQDNQLIGGFGIGAKSPSCYTDTFFVRSFYEGIETLYSCSLGAGEYGVPVGHIYDVEKNPTTENGLEVFVPIKSKDEYEFAEKIKNIVQISPKNAIARIFNEEFAPFPVVKEESIDGFDFRIVKCNDIVNKTATLQMGGVKYSSVYLPYEINLLSGYELIADLKVGSMSLPLSRQEFENTEANRVELEKLKAALEKFVTKELSKDKPKSFIEAVEKLFKDGKRRFEGEFFSFPWCLAAGEDKDTQNLFEQLRFANDPSVDTLERDKTGATLNIVLVPNNQATQYWKDKLKNFCHNTKKAYAFIVTDTTPNVKAANFISIKSLPFPKSSISSGCRLGEFTVLMKHGRKTRMNAVKLHNIMMKDCGYVGAEAATIEEAKKQYFDYFSTNTPKTIGDLERRAFAFKQSSFNYSNHNYSLNSAFAKKMMEEIGWQNPLSPSFISIKNNLLKVKLEREEREQKIQKARIFENSFSSRTVQTLEKIRNGDITDRQLSSCLKLAKAAEKISQENSVRGKVVLHLTSGSSWSRLQINRQELRKILKIKA